MSCHDCIYWCKDSLEDGAYCLKYRSILDKPTNDNTRGLYRGTFFNVTRKLKYKNLSQREKDILFLDSMDASRMSFY